MEDMTYAFASKAKAMTAIRTLFAVMVFAGTSVAAVLIVDAHTLTALEFRMGYNFLK